MSNILIVFLFIADLHLNQFANKELVRYLESRERNGVECYYLGDNYIFPRLHDGRLSGTFLAGNHEVLFQGGLKETVVLDGHILLLHGHQAEWQNHSVLAVFKDAWDVTSGFFRRYFRHEKRRLGRLHYQPLSDFARRPRVSEVERLHRLHSWVKRRFPHVDTVILGHHHYQYVYTYKDILFLNCGAGFKGQHLVRDSHGSFWFAHFEQNF